MKMVLYLILGVLILSLVGFLLGILLAIIAQIFKVEIDPRVDKIKDILPGINCGACGYPGCSVYAEAILKEDSEINLCTPGGADVVQAIGSILGKKAEINLKMVAKVFCLGDDAIAKKDYIFNGEEECLTVQNYFQGEKSCKYSCVGKGNCIRVCPVDAVKRDDLNRIWIDAELCVGCERCVSVCPPDVIKMVPVNGGHFVACSSHYKGKVVKEICKKGCIGCNICAKMVHDEKRVIMDDFLAVVKYENDLDLHQAAVRCPSNVIVPIKTQLTFMKENVKEKPAKPVRKAAPPTKSAGLTDKVDTVKKEDPPVKDSLNKEPVKKVPPVGTATTVNSSTLVKNTLDGNKTDTVVKKEQAVKKTTTLAGKEKPVNKAPTVPKQEKPVKKDNPANDPKDDNKK